MTSRVVRACDAARILSLTIDLVLASMCDPKMAADESWRLASIICLKKVRDSGNLAILLVARDEIKAWIVNHWRNTVENALSHPNAIFIRLPATADERAFLSALMRIRLGYSDPAP